jgi:DNA-binding NarL/FixJ family response regulator
MASGTREQDMRDEVVASIFLAGKNLHRRFRMVKTLIVEDNPNFCQTLKEGLQRRFPSMVIEEIGNGNEVLKQVDLFHPHLIFIDIRLPGKNGLQLTQEIKSAYPGTIIIVMTSYNLPEYRDAALKYGAHRFIPKDALSWEEIEALVKPIPLD